MPNLARAASKFLLRLHTGMYKASKDAAAMTNLQFIFHSKNSQFWVSLLFAFFNLAPLHALHQNEPARSKQFTLHYLSNSERCLMGLLLQQDIVSPRSIEDDPSPPTRRSCDISRPCRCNRCNLILRS